jgi:predicted flap endonuclease-1-like 5' DNA nuclease/predicted  nucleic acid-binding Zn-ribbon protein
MTTAELSKLLPILLPTAACFALIGWWLRGKKKIPVAAVSTTAKVATPSNSERQRLREVEGKLRTTESTLSAAQSELSALRATSVPQATHAALAAELETARTNASALEVQLKKSRDVQTTLQAQANDAGKKIQARAIGLENELSAARTEILRLKALADPNTDGLKRADAEIETIRTRLRAVEAQLAERNAEVNAQKARSLSTTARAPRTIAASAAVAGAPLNLLGFDTASQVLSAASEPTLENPVAALLPDETAVIPDNAIATAGSIFGKRIEPDDLTLIEGIGPAIRNLLAGAGFATWESLANAEPEQLHAILVEAGPAFAAHSPASWPEQARLAANANWFQLKSLQDKLVAGRALESAPESTDG